MLILLLRFVHFLSMAAWFGSALGPAGDLRRTLAESGDVAALRLRMRRANMINFGGALGTVLSGLGLIFTRGGMAAVPWPIHAGLTLGLVLWALGAFGLGGTWRAVDAMLESGAAPGTLGPLVKRYSALTGAFHALWFLTLALMVFRGQA